MKIVWIRLENKILEIIVGAYGPSWCLWEDLVWMEGANRPRSASPLRIFLMRPTGRRYGNWGHNKPLKATPPANLPRNPRTPQTSFCRGHKQDQPQEPGKKSSLCSKVCQESSHSIQFKSSAIPLQKRVFHSLNISVCRNSFCFTKPVVFALKWHENKKKWMEIKSFKICTQKSNILLWDFFFILKKIFLWVTLRMYHMRLCRHLFL